MVFVAVAAIFPVHLVVVVVVVLLPNSISSMYFFLFLLCSCVLLNPLLTVNVLSAMMLTLLLLYICVDFSLVFCRKDLCEARVNSRVSSYFQTRCTLRWDDPPFETVSDWRSSIAWSMPSMRTHLKQLVELGQVFRWGVPSHQIYPPVFRWPVSRQN